MSNVWSYRWLIWDLQHEELLPRIKGGKRIGNKQHNIIIIFNRKMLVVSLLVFVSRGIRTHVLPFPPFILYHQANLISPTTHGNLCKYNTSLPFKGSLLKHKARKTNWSHMNSRGDLWQIKMPTLFGISAGAKSSN